MKIEYEIDWNGIEKVIDAIEIVKNSAATKDLCLGFLMAKTSILTELKKYCKDPESYIAAMKEKP